MESPERMTRQKFAIRMRDMGDNNKEYAHPVDALQFILRSLIQLRFVQI